MKVDEESRSIEFPISSELPVERWFGKEILSHDPSAVDLARFNDGANLLFNHDWDTPIGVIEKSWIGDDRRMHVRVRFSKNKRAQEIFDDVKDGVLRNVSFGYEINEIVREKSDETGDTYKATRWTPYEGSIVTVPADHTVGIGRSKESLVERELTVGGVPKFDPAAAIEKTITRAEEVLEIKTKAAPAASQGVKMEDVQKERERVKAIRELGKQHKMTELADQFEDNGKSVDEFRSAVLEKLGVRQTAVTGKEADVGLTDREVQDFSIMKAIRHLANPGDARLREAAAFEIEVSIEGAKKRGKDSQGIFIPFEILRAKRDLSKGTPSAGGYLVATEHKPESFIELLRKKSALDRAGARVLNGLVGDIAIPKQTGGATAYWVAEAGSPTESQQTFGQVAMAPKTVGAFTDLSRKLMLQSSPDVENIVKADLAAVLALAIDLAGISGSGNSNQPLGIKNTSGINTKDFSSAAAPTFAELVDMETKIAADDADVEAMKYLANSAFRGYAKSTVKFSSNDATIWEPGGTVNGYNAVISNQMADNDVIFGNFADLMIGYWSGLDLMVDKAALATAGGTRVIVLQDVDVAVRHAESFCLGNGDQ